MRSARPGANPRNKPMWTDTDRLKIDDGTKRTQTEESKLKMPIEKWTQEVNEGKTPPETYFVMKNLCARIDELVAAKGAGA